MFRLYFYIIHDPAVCTRLNYTFADTGKRIKKGENKVIKVLPVKENNSQLMGKAGKST